MQDEINLGKDVFRDRFGEVPRKDDLTILVPRQDDPTEQVRHCLPCVTLVLPLQTMGGGRYCHALHADFRFLPRGGQGWGQDHQGRWLFMCARMHHAKPQFVS